jgi:hypothetical protein
MVRDPSTSIVLRQLTGSELGWFAVARRAGRAKGNQRGINFNAAVMECLFTPVARKSGKILVVTTRFADNNTQTRPIRRQKKNWRLVGDRVQGVGLEHVAEGDYFWASIDVPADSGPARVIWDVVCLATDAERHSRLSREYSTHLLNRMACWYENDALGASLSALVGPSASSPVARKDRRPDARIRQPAELKSRPLPETSAAPPRRRRIDTKLGRPHILAEIVKSGMALSATNQADYMDVLNDRSTELRTLLLDAGWIQNVEISHARFWAGFKGRRIGFVDGGVANVNPMGAQPLAVRVCSYVVVPGTIGPDRETFGPPEVQLVDELYAPSSGRGVYDEWFDDAAKLRDAARIVCEIAGLHVLTRREPRPDVVLLHGPLVNPVSPYALGTPGDADAFPNFTGASLAKLMPDGATRLGRDANFVSVYLDLLTQLTASPVSVCGVVERHARSHPLLRLLTGQLLAKRFIDNTTYHDLLQQYETYDLTDTVMFECVLEPGEYVSPLQMNKQGAANKIPVAWSAEIARFPAPWVTYVKPSADAMPIRVESFETGSVDHHDLMALIVHTSRLLPRYVFPVGLDIVDKHAKVPEWMSRQVNVMLQAQLMRKAMDTANPNAVRLAKRILSANTRDWLFRPDFKGQA